MFTVSVVIPVFNCARYVGSAIESVLRQSFKPAEIIVVDDGSTDQSPEIIKSYPVSYVRKANGGPSSARNVGIRSCQGDYVAFLDADDVWLDGKLKTQVKALQRFPEAAFSFSTIWHFDDGKDTEPTQPYYSRELSKWISTRKTSDGSVFGNVYEVLLSSNCVDTCSVVAKRHALMEAGLFDESLTVGEDHELWLRLGRKHPAVFMLNPTSRYRVHSASLTGSLATRPDVFYRSTIRVLEKHLAMFPSHSVRKALSSARIGFALFHLKSGERSQARDLAVRSFRDSPNLLAVKVALEAAYPRLYALLANARHGRRALRHP
jgi:glycosyltransferase involved in cell wall biosynthesis